MKLLTTIILVLGFGLTASSQTATISSISPNQGQRGQTLDLHVIGASTSFGTSTNLTITIFNAFTTYQSKQVTVVNDTHLIANITLPSNFAYQNCDVVISEGNSFSIIKKEGFKIVDDLGYTPKMKSYAPTSVNTGQTLDLKMIIQDATLPKNYTVLLNFIEPQSITVNKVTVLNDSVLIANITISEKTTAGYYPFFIASSKLGIIYAQGLGLLVGKGSEVEHVVKVYPNKVTINQQADLTITGANIDFTKFSSSIEPFFHKGDITLKGINTKIVSPTEMRTSLVLKDNIDLSGLYDLVFIEPISSRLYIFTNAIYIGATLGLNKEQLKSAYQIYPNPTQEVLFIETKQNIHLAQLTDLTGRQFTIEQQDLQQQAGKYKLDLKKYNLPPGIYFIKLPVDEGYTYQKICIN